MERDRSDKVEVLRRSPSSARYGKLEERSVPGKRKGIQDARRAKAAPSCPSTTRGGSCSARTTTKSAHAQRPPSPKSHLAPAEIKNVCLVSTELVQRLGRKDGHRSDRNARRSLLLARFVRSCGNWRRGERIPGRGGRVDRFWEHRCVTIFGRGEYLPNCEKSASGSASSHEEERTHLARPRPCHQQRGTSHHSRTWCSKRRSSCVPSAESEDPRRRANSAKRRPPVPIVTSGLIPSRSEESREGEYCRWARTRTRG